MISPSKFYDLASGRTRGIPATLCRGALRVAESPYRAAVAWRNRKFDRGAAEVHRAAVPVISVGNITVGGTGKTPLVKWIARYLGEAGLRVGILSRGYGTAAGTANDEALELAMDLPGVVHLQNPDRVASARMAVQEHGVQVLLLDDGFQHRRLARDLDIVLLDALEPFGFGHLLPRGTLREPCSALARADVIVLSRVDLVDERARREIRSRVQILAPNAAWCEAAYHPSGLINAAGERHALEELAGKRVAAFCGIGNPRGFEATLRGVDVTIAAWREFPDHHAYTRRDLDGLTEWSRDANAEAVVCTQKDLVKIPLARLGESPLWALAIGTEFLTGRDELCRFVAAATGLPLSAEVPKARP